jgi:hypothetical protein
MTIATHLDAIREHLATFELPEPWDLSVAGSAVVGYEQVTAQLCGNGLPHVARVLLAWADTLTEISAEVWRTPDGCSVHLAIKGRLMNGTTVRVFDRADHDTHFALDVRERRTISLACLREWASFDEGVAA